MKHSAQSSAVGGSGAKKAIKCHMYWQQHFSEQHFELMFVTFTVWQTSLWTDVRYVCNEISSGVLWLSVSPALSQLMSNIVAHCAALISSFCAACIFVKTLNWYYITLQQSVACIFSRTCQLPSVTGSSTSLHLHWGSHFSLFNPRRSIHHCQGSWCQNDVLLKVDQTQMYGPYIKLHR